MWLHRAEASGCRYATLSSLLMLVVQYVATVSLVSLAFIIAL